MLSNLPPDTSGMDSDPHWPDCRTNCPSPRFGRSDTCMDGHQSHECNCEDVAMARGIRLAEAGDDL